MDIVKYSINKPVSVTVGVILVVIFGLGVWFQRHSRKKRIQMMFGN